MRKVLFKDGRLRAPWGIAIFLLLVVAMRVAQYFCFTHPLGAQILQTPLGMFAEEALRAGIVIFATWVLARVEGRSWLAYGLGGPSKMKLLAIGSGMGLLTLSVLIGILVQTGHATFAVEPMGAAQAIIAGIVWLLAFYAVAFFEELLLRGYLQFTLGKQIGFWWSALAWSLIFVWMHIGNDGESVLGLAQTGVMAMFFCLSLRVTGSLWWAIGFHALWDWSESFLYGTANSGFLIELARDDKLPIDVRRSAVLIARHFPTVEQISAVAFPRHPSGLGLELASPDEVPSWIEGCRYGPLRHSTRLAMPERTESVGLANARATGC